MSQMFNRAKNDRNSVSKPVLETDSLKNRGRVSVLERIQASSNEAEGKAPVDAQSLSDEALTVYAQLALKSKANRFLKKPIKGSVSVLQGTNQSFCKDEKRRIPLSKTSVQDRLGPRNLDSLRSGQVNDLRCFLNNKRKLNQETSSEKVPLRCELTGCQLITLHSAQCCGRTTPVLHDGYSDDHESNRESVFN
jgi:hypothetical protein